QALEIAPQKHRGAVMGAHSRNKGSAFERAIAARLFDLTGVTLKRDLEQYRAADHGDLIADNDQWPFLIECKAYAIGTGCKPEWKSQATAAGKSVGKLPVVIYKFNR